MVEKLLPKGASNVQVNVTVNVDQEILSKVMVEVLKNADIVKKMAEALAPK